MHAVIVNISKYRYRSFLTFCVVKYWHHAWCFSSHLAAWTQQVKNTCETQITTQLD